MKPPIEYRSDAAPESDAPTVKKKRAYTKRVPRPPMPKPESDPGAYRTVWVPDDSTVSIRNKEQAREYQREYKRRTRAEKRAAVKAPEGPT